MPSTDQLPEIAPCIRPGLQSNISTMDSTQILTNSDVDKFMKREIVGGKPVFSTSQFEASNLISKKGKDKLSTGAKQWTNKKKSKTNREKHLQYD